MGAYVQSEMPKMQDTRWHIFVCLMRSSLSKAEGTADPSWFQSAWRMPFLRAAEGGGVLVSKMVLYLRPRPGVLLNHGGPLLLCVLTKQAAGRRVLGNSQAPITLLITNPRPSTNKK